jgi:hypothetical protein
LFLKSFEQIHDEIFFTGAGKIVFVGKLECFKVAGFYAGTA